jgi:hypothetical protein
VSDLVRGAHDGVVCYSHREHSVNEVCEGRDAVHENPEVGEDGRRRQDATEDKAEGKHELRNVAGGFCRLNRSYNHGCEGGCEEKEFPDQEEHEATAFSYVSGRYSVFVQSDGVVPTEEDQDCHKRIPGQLDDDVGDHEGFPGVCFGRALARFIQGALGDEVGHNLLNKLAEDGEEHEDGEHLVLQFLLRRSRIEEGKPDEKSLVY